MWLFEKDKILHAIAGFTIAYIAYFFMVVVFTLNPWLSLLYAAVISVIASLAKELIWDKWLGKGVMNWKDFYAGCIGDGICVLTILFILLVIA